jgi:prepilin-type N-terminal cleavage/methylation domain-containing protein
MRPQQTRDSLRLMQRHSDERAFTLIELMTVIAVVAILFGIAFPAYISVMERARKTQAKNDLTQIVTAVNAYYTEYGKYPLPSGTAIDTIYGPGGTPNGNLFYSLRAIVGGDNVLVNGVPAINPRQIVFINPPNVKDDTAGNRRSGVSPTDGNYYDPWGTPYAIEIDGDYNNQITTNPYTTNTGAGPSPLTIGVIAWSLGKDQTIGTKTPASASFTNSDDVISWQ